MQPSSPKQTVSVKYQPQDSTKSTVEICRPLNSNPPITDPKNSFSTQNSDPTVAPNLQLLLLLHLLLLLCTPSYSNFHSALKKNTIFFHFKILSEFPYGSLRVLSFSHSLLPICLILSFLECIFSSFLGSFFFLREIEREYLTKRW